jgi:hypothetical protein
VKEFFLKPILVNDMAKVIRSALAAPEGGA